MNNKARLSKEAEDLRYVPKKEYDKLVDMFTQVNRKNRELQKQIEILEKDKERLLERTRRRSRYE